MDDWKIGLKGGKFNVYTEWIGIVCWTTHVYMNAFLNKQGQIAKS